MLTEIVHALEDGSSSNEVALAHFPVSSFKVFSSVQKKCKKKKISIVLIASEDFTAHYCAIVSKNQTGQYSATEICSILQKHIGGNFGGASSQAQGQGNNIQKIPDALTELKAFLRI